MRRKYIKPETLAMTSRLTAAGSCVTGSPEYTLTGTCTPGGQAYTTCTLGSVVIPLQFCNLGTNAGYSCVNGTTAG